MMRAIPPVLRSAAGVFAIAAALSGCTRTQGMLDAAGPDAAAIEGLWWWLFNGSTVVFVLVMLTLACALAARPSGADAHQPPPAVLMRSYRVIAISLGLTAVVLFGFLVASMGTDRKLQAFEAKPARSITITGKQWWWDVRYDDDQPGNVFHTANEIHVPVGQPVQLQLRSTDVIHSFWVPSLAGKKDLIPGRDASLWLQADRPGEFEGQCAEFCGHQHAHMRILVVAEEPARFEEWLKRQRAPASEPQTDAQRRGRDVFLGNTCLMCHSIRGTNAGSHVGPDLTHLATRRTLGAATLRNTREHLAVWVADPQSIKPGARMPPQWLPPEDFAALLDYLTHLQ